MFSIEEKQAIAAAVEKALLDLNHPEMPKTNPKFTLRVEGKEDWSWAEITPNWAWKAGKAINTWNEVARRIMTRK